MIELSGGLDEVGLGSLAGPVCVAVTVYPRDIPPPIEGIKDSKAVSKKKRERLAPLIMESATFVGIGWSSPEYVDLYGISLSWQHAARQALANAPVITTLYVDGERAVKGYQGEQVVAPRLDATNWLVSAASIVAKVSRDHDMSEMSIMYPGYQFEKNAGYGTTYHQQRILDVGSCPYHRKTFLKKLYGKV